MATLSAMETTKDEYRRKMETQLAAWAAKIGVLKAKVAKAGADSKVHLQEQTDKLTALEKSAREHLASVEATAATKWDEVKADVNDKWNHVSGALEALWAKVS
jgi:hypothetical protein